MFPASMRDILNHVQTMELDEDVAILDGTFDIGIDQIRSIPRDQPTPNWKDGLWRQDSFIGVPEDMKSHRSWNLFKSPEFSQGTSIAIVFSRQGHEMFTNDDFQLPEEMDRDIGAAQEKIIRRGDYRILTRPRQVNPGRQEIYRAPYPKG
ncbi:hypothetical protein Tco_0626987 [Tanacetum coccineum]|uniref:Uncharacterized protein n=1 Tax=Tanacetum coccineum TaxID=301880 RepID=A0ABQ4WL34_9ASTR